MANNRAQINSQLFNQLAGIYQQMGQGVPARPGWASGGGGAYTNWLQSEINNAQTKLAQYQANQQAQQMQQMMQQQVAAQQSMMQAQQKSIAAMQSSELPTDRTLKPSSFRISLTRSLMSSSSSTTKISDNFLLPKKY